MKKFIIILCAVVLAIFVINIAYYNFGLYLDFDPENDKVETSVTTMGKDIYLYKNGRFQPFEIRGVDMGVGVPGEWATDFAIDKETYKRWFKEIQDMGANTIRVYTILHDDFYNAFYEYNVHNVKPLYLIQGVWVEDYDMYCHMDAYDPEFYGHFTQDCRTMVDVIHGQKSISLSYGNKGNGMYRRDITPWVIGYILGVEWEHYTVEYTNQKNEGMENYEGKYMFTTEDATPFESFLAEVGDKIIEYETERYGTQRLVAFANWPTTDPFVYPESVVIARNKTTSIDIENIKINRVHFLSGTFASYHIYSYFPDYLEIMRATASLTEADYNERLGPSNWGNMKYFVSQLKGPRITEYLQDRYYTDRKGRYNTYLAYLKTLNLYHTMPVVISEYGVTTGRGMAQMDANTGRNQGHMSEQEQGQGIIDCYNDIMDAGCAGSCIFSWQDEWFKRTWNTKPNVDLDKTPYWSDYQTNEQFFGLLTFDPGKEESVCYVDKDVSEWSNGDKVTSYKDMELSMKYDEKFIYFLVHDKKGISDEDTVYIPLDITPKSGSKYCYNYNISFENPVDFVIKIQGKDNSRILVQKRYEALNAIYGKDYYGELPYFDPPEADGYKFTKILMPLTRTEYIPFRNSKKSSGRTFETGKLKYGIANPDSTGFDSLADFCFSGKNNEYLEIRIPWGLINFSNPSEMEIHDDYYENYGIENLAIDKIYVGVSDTANKDEVIPMEKFPLKPWYQKVTAHERLKKSYYMIKDYWAMLDMEMSKNGQ